MGVPARGDGVEKSELDHLRTTGQIPWQWASGRKSTDWASAVRAALLIANNWSSQRQVIRNHAVA